MTDKKGDKTQNNTDTVTNKKGDILPRTEHLCSQGKQKETEGRQGGHSDQQEGKQGRQAGRKADMLSRSKADILRKA